MAHEHHIAGFLVSASVHLGVLALIFTGVSSVKPVTERALPLKLSMFQPPPAPVVEPAPEPIQPIVKQDKPVEPPPSPEPAPRPKPRPKRKVAHKPVVKPVPKPPPAPKTSAVEDPVVTVAKIPVQPVPDLALIKRVENEYRAKLQAAIEAQKKYPRRARRLRHQGSVMVAFKVQKDGLIKGIRVTAPSDSSILDEAAMETVLKISGLFPLPEELQRTEWSFSIPINYYLR